MNGMIFDFVFNSAILVSIAFALFSVLVYLILTRIKNEKHQFITAITGGFFLVAISGFFSGVSVISEIIQIVGTILILIAPLIVFKIYLNTKYELVSVFLISALYPVYFRSTQYMCGGPAMVGYYPEFVAVLGDCIGPFILSLAAVSVLIGIRRVYEKLKPGKILIIVFGLLIPALLWFPYSVASASVAVLFLIVLNEFEKTPHHFNDVWISALIIISAVVIALPWHFLVQLPCIRNFFPIWIVPVLGMSLATAAPFYYIRSKIPEKWMEITVFTVSFAVSLVLFELIGLIG